MVDRNETREPDSEHVREALGEPGERPQRGARPGLDTRRDREARERLGERESQPDEAAEGGLDPARADVAEGDEQGADKD